MQILHMASLLVNTSTFELKVVLEGRLLICLFTVLFLEETAWVTFAIALYVLGGSDASWAIFLLIQVFDLCCWGETWVVFHKLNIPNGVSPHKGGDTAEKSSLVSIHCSLEPSVSLPALLFFFPLQNAFFFKETNQTKQTQACLWGSAISSYFMVAEGAGERVLLMAKVILGGPSPLFLPNLRLPSDVLWFGGENL